MEKRYFIYCRKSTDEEDRQVLSLSAQKNEIEEFMRKSGLKIGGVFEECQSAKTAGRPKFNEMVRLLEKGRADGVIVHKMDRLTRNLWDTARISDLMANGKEFISVVGWQNRRNWWSVVDALRTFFRGQLRWVGHLHGTSRISCA